jgi:hypothetical protein
VFDDISHFFGRRRRKQQAMEETNTDGDEWRGSGGQTDVGGRDGHGDGTPAPDGATSGDGAKGNGVGSVPAGRVYPAPAGSTT